MKQEHADRINKLINNPEALEKGIDTRGKVDLKNCIDICVEKADREQE